MPAVGAYLRELRERHGVSIDEISRSTRVLHHYLEALETDNFASLPAPVFAKGFIRAYCQALGVAPDEALALYEQRVGQDRTPPPSLVPPPRPAPPRLAPPRPAPAPRGAAPTRPAPQPRVEVHASMDTPLRVVPHLRPTPAPALEHDIAPPPLERAAVERPAERRESRPRGTVLISFVLLVVLGAAFFAVTMALQSGRDDGDGGAAVHVAAAPPTPPPVQTPAPEPTPSEPAPPPQPPVAAQPPKQPPVAAPTVAPNPAPTPAVPRVATPTPTPTPTPATSPAIALVAPYRLVARTSETTWMRVRTEDGRTSEETIPANEVREWVSNGPFVLTIGNAGGVSLELNGRPVPRLGASGAVITRMVLPPDVQ